MSQPTRELVDSLQRDLVQASLEAAQFGRRLLEHQARGSGLEPALRTWNQLANRLGTTFGDGRDRLVAEGCDAGLVARTHQHLQDLAAQTASLDVCSELDQAVQAWKDLAAELAQHQGRQAGRLLGMLQAMQPEIDRATRQLLAARQAGGIHPDFAAERRGLQAARDGAQQRYEQLRQQHLAAGQALASLRQQPAGPPAAQPSAGRERVLAGGLQVTPVGPAALRPEAGRPAPAVVRLPWDPRSPKGSPASAPASSPTTSGAKPQAESAQVAATPAAEPRKETRPRPAPAPEVLSPFGGHVSRSEATRSFGRGADGLLQGTRTLQLEIAGGGVVPEPQCAHQRSFDLGCGVRFDVSTGIQWWGGRPRDGGLLLLSFTSSGGRLGRHRVESAQGTAAQQALLIDRWVRSALYQLGIGIAAQAGTAAQEAARDVFAGAVAPPRLEQVASPAPHAAGQTARPVVSNGAPGAAQKPARGVQPPPRLAPKPERSSEPGHPAASHSALKAASRPASKPASHSATRPAPGASGPVEAHVGRRKLAGGLRPSSAGGFATGTVRLEIQLDWAGGIPAALGGGLSFDLGSGVGAAVDVSVAAHQAGQRTLGTLGVRVEISGGRPGGGSPGAILHRASTAANGARSAVAALVSGQVGAAAGEAAGAFVGRTCAEAFARLRAAPNASGAPASGPDRSRLGVTSSGTGTKIHAPSPADARRPVAGPRALAGGARQHQVQKMEVAFADALEQARTTRHQVGGKRVELLTVMELDRERDGVAERLHQTFSSLSTAASRSLVDQTGTELRVGLARVDALVGKLQGTRGAELAAGAEELSHLLGQLGSVATRSGGGQHLGMFRKLLQERKQQLNQLHARSGRRGAGADLLPVPGGLQQPAAKGGKQLDHLRKQFPGLDKVLANSSHTELGRQLTAARATEAGKLGGAIGATHFGGALGATGPGGGGRGGLGAAAKLLESGLGGVGTSGFGKLTGGHLGGLGLGHGFGAQGSGAGLGALGAGALPRALGFLNKPGAKQAVLAAGKAIGRDSSRVLAAVQKGGAAGGLHEVAKLVEQDKQRIRRKLSHRNHAGATSAALTEAFHGAGKPELAGQFQQGGILYGLLDAAQRSHGKGVGALTSQLLEGRGQKNLSAAVQLVEGLKAQGYKPRFSLWGDIAGTVTSVASSVGGAVSGAVSKVSEIAQATATTVASGVSSAVTTAVQVGGRVAGTISTVTQRAAGAVGSTVRNLANAAGSGVGRAIKRVRSVADRAVDWTVDAAGSIASGVSSLAQRAAGALGAGARWVGRGLSSVASAVGRGASALGRAAGKGWDFASNIAGQAWTGAKGVAGQVWEAEKRGLGRIWEGTKGVAGQVWEAEKRGLGRMWDGAGRVWEGAKGAAGQVWEAEKRGLGKIWDGTKFVAGKAWDGAKAVGGAAWDYAKKSVAGQAVGWLWDKAEGLGRAAWSGLKKGAGAIGGFLMDVGKGALSWAGNKLGSAWTAMKCYGRTALDKAGKAASWVGDKASAAGSWVMDKASGAAKWVGDKASAAGAWISDKAGSALSWAADKAKGAGSWIGEKVKGGLEWVNKTGIVGAIGTGIRKGISGLGKVVEYSPIGLAYKAGKSLGEFAKGGALQKVMSGLGKVVEYSPIGLAYKAGKSFGEFAKGGGLQKLWQGTKSLAGKALGGIKTAYKATSGFLQSPLGQGLVTGLSLAASFIPGGMLVKGLVGAGIGAITAMSEGKNWKQVLLSAGSGALTGALPFLKIGPLAKMGVGALQGAAGALIQGGNWKDALKGAASGAIDNFSPGALKSLGKMKSLQGITKAFSGAGMGALGKIASGGGKAIAAVERVMTSPRIRKAIGSIEKVGSKVVRGGIWLSGKAAKVSDVADKVLTVGDKISGALGKINEYAPTVAGWVGDNSLGQAIAKAGDYAGKGNEKLGAALEYGHVGADKLTEYRGYLDKGLNSAGVKDPAKAYEKMMERKARRDQAAADKRAASKPGKTGSRPHKQTLEGLAGIEEFRKDHKAGETSAPKVPEHGLAAAQGHGGHAPPATTGAHPAVDGHHDAPPRAVATPGRDHAETHPAEHPARQPAYAGAPHDPALLHGAAPKGGDHAGAAPHGAAAGQSPAEHGAGAGHPASARRGHPDGPSPEGHPDHKRTGAKPVPAKREKTTLESLKARGKALQEKAVGVAAKVDKRLGQVHDVIGKGLEGAQKIQAGLEQASDLAGKGADFLGADNELGRFLGQVKENADLVHGHLETGIGYAEAVNEKLEQGQGMLEKLPGVKKRKEADEEAEKEAEKAKEDAKEKGKTRGHPESPPESPEPGKHPEDKKPEHPDDEKKPGRKPEEKKKYQDAVRKLPYLEMGFLHNRVPALTSELKSLLSAGKSDEARKLVSEWAENIETALKDWTHALREVGSLERTPLEDVDYYKLFGLTSDVLAKNVLEFQKASRSPVIFKHTGPEKDYPDIRNLVAPFEAIKAQVKNLGDLEAEFTGNSTELNRHRYDLHQRIERMAKNLKGKFGKLKDKYKEDPNGLKLIPDEKELDGMLEFLDDQKRWEKRAEKKKLLEEAEKLKAEEAAWRKEEAEKEAKKEQAKERAKEQAETREQGKMKGRESREDRKESPLSKELVQEAGGKGAPAEGEGGESGEPRPKKPKFVKSGIESLDRFRRKVIVGGTRLDRRLGRIEETVNKGIQVGKAVDSGIEKAAALADKFADFFGEDSAIGHFAQQASEVGKGAHEKLGAALGVADKGSAGLAKGRDILHSVLDFARGHHEKKVAEETKEQEESVEEVEDAAKEAGGEEGGEQGGGQGQQGRRGHPESPELAHGGRPQGQGGRGHPEGPAAEGQGGAPIRAGGRGHPECPADAPCKKGGHPDECDPEKGGGAGRFVKDVLDKVRKSAHDAAEGKRRREPEPVMGDRPASWGPPGRGRGGHPGGTMPVVGGRGRPHLRPEPPLLGDKPASWGPQETEPDGPGGKPQRADPAELLHRAAQAVDRFSKEVAKAIPLIARLLAKNDHKGAIGRIHGVSALSELARVALAEAAKDVAPAQQKQVSGLRKAYLEVRGHFQKFVHSLHGLAGELGGEGEARIDAKKYPDLAALQGEVEALYAQVATLGDAAHADSHQAQATPALHQRADALHKKLLRLQARYRKDAVASRFVEALAGRLAECLQLIGGKQDKGKQREGDRKLGPQEPHGPGRGKRPGRRPGRRPARRPQRNPGGRRGHPTEGPTGPAGRLGAPTVLLADQEESGRVFVDRGANRGDHDRHDGQEVDPSAIDTWLGSGDGTKAFSDVFGAFLPAQGASTGGQVARGSGGGGHQGPESAEVVHHDGGKETDGGHGGGGGEDGQVDDHTPEDHLPDDPGAGPDGPVDPADPGDGPHDPADPDGEQPSWLLKTLGKASKFLGKYAGGKGLVGRASRFGKGIADKVIGSFGKGGFFNNLFHKLEGFADKVGGWAKTGGKWLGKGMHYAEVGMGFLDKVGGAASKVQEYAGKAEGFLGKIGLDQLAGFAGKIGGAAGWVTGKTDAAHGWLKKADELMGFGKKSLGTVEKVAGKLAPAFHGAETGHFGGLLNLFKASRNGPGIDGKTAPERFRGGALDEAKRLDAITMHRMETFLGGSFSDVKIHTGAGAAEVTRRYDAEAVTVKDHVFFAPGRFRPGTAEGERLIAHELTHVLQKGRANLDVKTAEGEALASERGYGPGPQMQGLNLSRPEPDFKFADGEGMGASSGVHTAKRTRSKGEEVGGQDAAPDGEEFLEQVGARVYEILMEELEQAFESR